MKTFSTKMSEVRPAWHVLDAADQPLGRLATRAAALLRGKHKPTYQPNLPMGDFVVIVNAERVRVTGNKVEDKIYYRHTQYPGGLRQATFREQLEKRPTRAVEKAVKGMLPHNRLGRHLFTRLKVYAGPEHPHQAQVNGAPSVVSGFRLSKSTRPAVVIAAASTTVAGVATAAGIATAMTAAAPPAEPTPAVSAAMAAPTSAMPETAATEAAPDTIETTETTATSEE